MPVFAVEVPVVASITMTPENSKSSLSEEVAAPLFMLSKDGSLSKLGEPLKKDSSMIFATKKKVA